MDIYSPIRGKCTWWREIPSEEDAHDLRVKAPDKRVNCSCFVEGEYWIHRSADVPSDCPNARSCRYYIKHY
ncbi:MAG: hypothetical protein OEV43_00815 [Coriobacteriia bacterium]|nr:hypothetical protein [Coriobacteriia bacterium]